MSDPQGQGVETPGEGQGADGKYRVGDRVRSGAKIRHIMHEGPHHIIFRDEMGYVRCESFNVPDHLLPIFAEYDRVLLEAEESLAHSAEQHLAPLAARCLALALDHKDERDPMRIFDPARKLISKLGPIEETYGHGPGFGVWRTAKGGVGWYHFDPAGGARQHLPEFSRLSSIARSSLSSPQRDVAMSLLGSGLHALFVSPEPERLEDPFNDARKFIETRGAQSVRNRYVGVTVFLLVVASALPLWKLYQGEALTGAFAESLAVGCWGGVVGAGVSLLQRVGGLDIDPLAPRLALALQAFVRVFVGAIFGGLVAAVSSADIALGLIGGAPLPLFVFAVVAGFNERFVPDLLDDLARSSVKKPKDPEGSDPDESG